MKPRPQSTVRKPWQRGGPINAMKKLVLTLTALALVPSLASAQQTVEEIIARVNNQIITKSEYTRSKDQLRDEAKQQDPANADKLYEAKEKDVLRDLIDQQLLLDKGKDLGITGDTEVIKELDQIRKEMKLPDMETLQKEAEKSGITWEDFKQQKKNQIVTRKVIGEEVGGHLSITNDDAQKFYEEHKQEMSGPEYIRLSEILVAPKPTTPSVTPAPDPNAAPGTDAAKQPTDAEKQAADEAALKVAEAKANDLLKKIHDGATFEDIAKQYSDGPSAQDGGALGTFTRGQLAKSLEDTTFAMKAGEITNVIQAKQGFLILKVVDHQQAGVPPFKDALPKIQDALYMEKLQPALRSYLTKLREEAYIKVAPGYVDSGHSANQTEPIETVAAKEADAKKLSKKKHKKLGII